MKSIFVYLVLACVILGQASIIRKKNDTIRTEKENVKVLTSLSNSFKTKSGQDARTIQSLTLDLKRAELYQNELEKDIKMLKLQKNKIETITELKIETRIDTVLYEKPDSVGVFEYKDAYTYVFVNPYERRLVFEHKEHLQLFRHWTRSKRFLFIKYGKKLKNTTVTSKNPLSVIESVEVIDIID